MTKELKKIIAMARKIKITPKDLEKQRISFAYGNTHFENERITRDTVENAAKSLKNKNGSKN